jgi:guanylate kinase
VAETAGILFVISAPSGTGKSTLAQRLVRGVPGLEFSISYTTRRARDGERDGEQYHFVSPEEFRSMAGQGAFLEWAEVYGELYGTGLEATRRALAEGRDLLLDIDVQGARQVRGGPVAAVSVMILPPDYATLEARLRGRGSEAEAVRRHRLAHARAEAEDFSNFDYLVVNDDLEETVPALQAIVTAERSRSVRRAAQAQRIIATFPPRG